FSHFGCDFAIHVGTAYRERRTILPARGINNLAHDVRSVSNSLSDFEHQEHVCEGDQKCVKSQQIPRDSCTLA
ncbi:MAG TPA: hypothetical protein VF787_07505, partial [Thermoanaerobaculia bacterium]